jgi:RND superfamily putative drug exporter
VKDVGVRILTVAAGRRARFVVLVAWLVIVAGIGSLAGKLDSVVKNEAESFLPGSAESSKVLKDIKRYPKGQTASAVVLYRRPGGLTSRRSTPRTSG